MRRILLRAVALTAAVQAFLGQAAFCQSGWDATLVIDPFPPAYLSDWELNPTIASLTVTNETGHDGDITIHFTITASDGRVVVSGRSEPQLVPAGMPTIYHTGSSVAGTSDYDTEIEDIVARTGRFPEDDYTACVTLSDASGFVVVDNVCADFSMLYPDPPSLLFPFDGDTVEAPDPILEWTPVQVPVAVQPNYVLQIAEILPGQPAYQALTANILQFEDAHLFTPSLQYPTAALPFENGKRYAWWVQALDMDGYPMAGNQGRSEIWTFTYRDPNGGSSGEEVGGSFHARLVHNNQAGTSTLANLGTDGYASVREALTDAENELLLPLPIPNLGPFDDVPLSNLQWFADDASQAIAITATASFPMGSVNILLLGIWESGPGTFTLGIEPAAFDLTAWISGLSGSDLANLDLDGSILTISSGAGTLDASSLPLAVERFYGTPTIPIEVGVSIHHELDISNTGLAQRLSRIGIEAKDLTITGNVGIDPNALFDSPSAASAPSLDLIATIEGDDLVPTPEWLSVNRYSIHITNDPNLALTAELAATAELPSRSIDFLLTAELSDSIGANVVLTGRVTTPWDGPFGIDWLTLQNVTLALRPGNDSTGTPASAVLSGELVVGQQPVVLEMTLEGSGSGIEATLSASIDELGIDDLLRFVEDRIGPVPFAGQIPGNLAALQNVRLEFRSGDPPTFTVLATATLLGQSTDVLYTIVPPAASGDDERSVFGFRLGDWSLGNLLPSLQGNPLGDFQFPAVSFVLGPPGQPNAPVDSTNPGGPTAGGGWSIPWSSFSLSALEFLTPSYPGASGGGPDDESGPSGGSALDLLPGVNFSAPFSLAGLSDALGGLFDFGGGGSGGSTSGDDGGTTPVLQGSPGVSLSDLLSGNLGLSGLLNLKAELPSFSSRPFGWPDWVSPGASSLEVTGDAGISVVVHLELDADLDGPKTFDVSARIENGTGGSGGGFEGTMRGGWSQPFGLQWLTLDSVFVALSQGSVGPRVALASAFDIGTVSAALGIDVRGTSDDRTVDFSASVRNISTADVASFLNDAFDANLGVPADPVTLDSLTVGFSTGDASSFALNGGFSTGMEPLEALAALADLLPGVSAPATVPFDIGTLASAWFDLHVVADSVWGGFGGGVSMGGTGSAPPFEGRGAIRLGASRTVTGSEWLALELDLAARDLSASNAMSALGDALPGDWALPPGLDALNGVTLDSARVLMALDSRTDSASAEFAGSGSYASQGGALAADATLGLFDVGSAAWAHGHLTVSLANVSVSDGLAEAAAILPGDWSLPSDVDALAPVQLDSASLTVGFDSRVDSLSATIRGAGTMGGAGGLAATAALALVQVNDEQWASGHLDMHLGSMPIPDALTQGAALLPGDWSLPSSISGLAPVTLDSATLGVAFDTRARSYSTSLTGASHLGDPPTRLDGSTELHLLQTDDEPIARGRVTLTVTDVGLTDVLAQVADLLPGSWSLPGGLSAFDALTLDSAQLEVGFDTRADSLGAHAHGAGKFGQNGLAATADLNFTRLATASGAAGEMIVARSALTMTEAIQQVSDILPGDWELPSGLDAFNAVSLDTAQLVLGFDTWADSNYAGLWGAGGFDGLSADARIDFTQTSGASRASGMMTLALGSVGAGEAIDRIAGILPGSWSLPSGFSSFDALTLDSASVFAGFDTGGDSLFAGFQGGGHLNSVAADGHLGFARVGNSSYGNGLVTLSLGDVSLSDAFSQVTDLLPGDWPAPSVDFDIGNLHDVGLELGFDTRTDSLWAGVGAEATLAGRDGVASLAVISVGSGASSRSWVTGTFLLDIGDVTLPGALSLAASLVPGAPEVPTLDFDIGGLSDAVLEAGFKAGDGDSAWVEASGGFRLGRRSGSASLALALGSSQPSGRFSASFDDRFSVSDVVDLFTGFLPGGGIELPPLGPLDVGIDDALLTLDFGARTGISLGGSSQLFGKSADALFSAATVGGKPRFTFGVQMPDLGFSDIVPGFENPITDQLRLALAALTVTNSDEEVNDEDLSPEERRFYRPIMGGLDDFKVDFNPGLNLTGLIPLADAGALKDMVDMLTPGAANVTLQGTLPLPGFGGLRDLALRGALPPMAPPGKPAWFVQGEIALEITGRPSVGVAGALTIDVDGDTLTFDVTSNVAIVPAGGVELSIAGGLEAENGWEGPLGVEWLTLNEVRLALGLSPIAVRLGFLGDAVFGTKDIRVQLGTKINIYTGVPIGVIVAGESQAGLSLGDLVSVADAVTGAAGGDPIPTDGVPDMAVRDLALKVATYSDPDIEVEAGFTIRGAFLLQTAANGPMNEMGRIELDIGLQGIVGLARLAAFSVGPVHFDDALLDLALTIPDQHLIIQGGATIDNAFSADIALAMSRDSMAFSTDFDLFGQFRTALAARASFQLLNPSFAIHAALYPEFSDALTLGVVQDLIPVGQATLQAASATLQAATTTLNATQKTLDDAIWAAGQAARVTMDAAYSSYRSAVNSYNYANSKYKHYRSKCSWRQPHHCVTRDYWRGVRSFWSTQKSIRWATYYAARTVYYNQDYLNSNPVVDAARKALADARASFNAAKAEVDRLNASLTQMQQWIDAYQSCVTCSRPPIPVSVVSAEFDAALAGFFGRSRVNMQLTYQVFGDRRTLSAGFGGSMSELVQPLFNAISDALF